MSHGKKAMACAQQMLQRVPGLLCDLATGVAVIVESTYGVSKHLPRDQREQRFVEKVRGILTRGGRVLLPVVALGRAQVQTHIPLMLHHQLMFCLVFTAEPGSDKCLSFLFLAHGVS